MTLTIKSCLSITFILCIVQIQCHHHVTNRLPVFKVPTSSLWQLHVDICQDPVHGGLHLESNGNYGNNELQIWMEVKLKMRSFLHDLGLQTRTLEGRICPSNLALIQNHTIHDFIQINTTSENQEPAVRLYKEISKMTYIFSVLESDGARQCCMVNHLLYAKLRNQVLPEMYNLISGAVLNWPIRRCIMSMRLALNTQLTCEEVENLVLLVYRYGLNDTEVILRQI